MRAGKRTGARGAKPMSRRRPRVTSSVAVYLAAPARSEVSAHPTAAWRDWFSCLPPHGCRLLLVSSRRFAPDYLIMQVESGYPLLMTWIIKQSNSHVDIAQRHMADRGEPRAGVCPGWSRRADSHWSTRMGVAPASRPVTTGHRGCRAAARQPRRPE